MCFTSLTKSKSFILLKYCGFHWVFAIDLFCSATLCDWLNKSCAIFQPVTSRTKTNHALLNYFSRALRQFRDGHSDWLI